MGTTSWGTARNGIAQELGYVSFTTTGNNIEAAQITSTALAFRYVYNDYFIGWFVMPEAGTELNKIRRVTDYTAATGIVAVPASSFSADNNARVCSLHRVHPGDLLNHFNQARLDLFPNVGIMRDIRMVTGQRQFFYTLPSTLRGKPLLVLLGNRDAADPRAENLLTDAGFEAWDNATTLTNYTLSGTGSTVNREQQTTLPQNYGVLQDQYSARVVAAVSTATTLLQTVTPSAATEGMELNLSVWVYCLTASRVSARISGTNVVSTPVDGTTHGGTGWERLTVSATLNSAATSFSVGLSCTSGAAIAFYGDEAMLIMGQSEDTEREWDGLRRWRWIPPVAGASNGGFLEFDYPLPPQRRIRILSRDLLSSVSSDTDTVQVDGEQLDMLYNRTRELAARSLEHNGPPQEAREWRARAEEYERRWRNAISEGKGLQWPPLRFQIPDWTW